MELFLSWSGERSKAAAKAFKEFVACLLQNVKPWMSMDIKAGDRWSGEVQAQLERSDFGIVFLTGENLSAPWLLFETGALAKKVSRSRVVPYLIGVNVADVPYGPLTQFQAKNADRTGTWEVIESINAALEDRRLEQKQVKKLFDRLWPDLERDLERDLAKAAEGEKHQDVRKREPDEVQEEILVTLRGIDRRLGSTELVSLSRPTFERMMLDYSRADVFTRMRFARAILNVGQQLSLFHEPQATEEKMCTECEEYFPIDELEDTGDVCICFSCMDELVRAAEEAEGTQQT